MRVKLKAGYGMTGIFMARCKINYTSAGAGFAHFERRGTFKIDGGMRTLYYFFSLFEMSCSGFQLSVVKPKPK